jgi:hypothetical protein
MDNRYTDDENSEFAFSFLGKANRFSNGETINFLAHACI